MRTKCGIIFAAVMLAAGLGCERRGDAASFAEFDARARNLAGTHPAKPL